MNKPSAMTILCEQTPVVILAGGKGTRLKPYTTPLRTARPIARLPRHERALLVLNGDCLTTLDFAKLVRFHYENRAVATIGTKRRTETVQFGVIEKAANGQ